MPLSRTVRAAVATMSALALTALPGRVDAQFPHPKLEGLSRSGVRSGESAEVTARGANLDGPLQLWFDHPGLKATPVKGATFRVSCGPEVPLGHHDVRVVDAYGVSNPRVFVVGDRPEEVEVEPNNAPAEARPIAINTTLSGEIATPTDVDCFAFEGKKGQRLFFDVQAERIDSPLDPTIRLLSASGKEVGESRDVFGADPLLDATLPADGRYVIKIHDAIYGGSPHHVYRLTVHDGPLVDAVLPLAVEPGGTSTVTLYGRGLGVGSSVAPKFQVDGQAIERLAISIVAPMPGGASGGLFLDPANPSRGFLPASAVARRGFETLYARGDPSGAAPVASNSFHLAEAAGPVVVEREPNDDVDHPQEVTLPCDISGTFGAPGDFDVYRFRAKKDSVWSIEAIAERAGSLADPSFVIQKVDPKGKEFQDLESGDDLPDAGAGPRFNTRSLDAAVRWRVPEDGVYQVMINDLYGSQRGDPRLTYRLVIGPEVPDFRIVLVPEKPLPDETIGLRAGGRVLADVVAVRLGGFRGPIRVEPASLPPGVSCAPVTIKAGAKVATVAFDAAEDAKTAIGVVTLIGRSKFKSDDKRSEEGPDLKRVAIAGGMTGPIAARAPTVAPARVHRGFVLAVQDGPAPLTLSASPATATTAQGSRIPVELAATRRAGFVEAVAVTTPDLPPNMPAAAATIPKEAKSATLRLFVPKNVAAGVYTIIPRGSGPYPFSKDPKAAKKPNITLTEPSNPIVLTVHPAPIRLNLDARGGKLKQGGSLEVEVKVTRQNGYAGSVAVTLDAPAAVKLSASPATLDPKQNQAKLVLKAAVDSPPGAAADLFIHARAVNQIGAAEVDEPLPLTIVK
jgi:hypothetical protein